MAPPSQAGKFKPRKPAKKIRVGEGTTAATAGTPIPIPSSASSSAQTNGGGGGRGRTATGGGRGTRGGGGGGGRGRGRHAEIQQGQAFFTATPPPVPARKKAASARSTSKTKKSTSSSKSKQAEATTTAAQVKKGQEDSQEEVVGVLEESVGAAKPAAVPSSAASKKKVKSEEALETDDGEQKTASSSRASSRTKKSLPQAGYIYDSDSSMEDLENQQSQPTTTMQPVVLPFPGPPMGIGGTEGQASLYPSDDETHIAVNNGLDASSITAKDPVTPSPFVDVHSEAAQSEKDSWFLVQLPTRLPPLQQGKHADQTQESASETAEVATQPIQANSFDNALTKAVSGRLGKIRVYKSGKTVLVMEGPGGKQLHMNVNEGLSCGFRQEAVAIDKDKGQYVALGEVQKTVVVTPDLERAFPET